MILYDLGFCKIDLHYNYIIATVNEGVNFSTDHYLIFREIIDEHFKNRPFIYISNRVNSYSIDPMVYIETGKIKNLVGIAVVSKNPKQKRITQVENMFLKREFHLFTNMEAALLWKDSVLANDETTLAEDKMIKKK